MRFTKSFLTLLLAALAIAGPRARCQAIPTGTQSTAIYVDGAKGSDINSNATITGTSVAPLQTIQAAINLANTRNMQNIGTKIVVNPGVYREALNISGGQTTAPLTIEAATAGLTVISGSDLLTGWSSDGNGVYSHSWTYNFGTCAVPNGWPSFGTIGRRTEMIFVNGASMTEVLSMSALTTRSFYVNASNHTIYVKPPSGTNMYTANVETAVRPQILSISGRSNVVLRGVVLEHARSCVNTSGSIISGGSNILVDNVQAVWNNWGGLLISGSYNVTVQNSVFSFNGGVGFLGNRIVGALFSYDKSDYNNWRGAQAHFYNWGMGGTKLMYMRNTTVQYLHAYGNQAQGLWFDTDNKNITINNVSLGGNTLSALQIEANEGPILLENSHLCNSGMGVTVLNTEKFTIKNNVFYDNGGTGQQYDAEIFIAGRPGGHVIYDWQTGQYYDLFTKDTILSGNVFDDARSGQQVFGTYLSGGDWYDFANTLNSSSNHWHDPVTAAAWKLPNGKSATFTGWKSAVGTDYTSVWASPSTSPAGACAVAAQ
jgi:hypothetical protein